MLYVNEIFNQYEKEKHQALYIAATNEYLEQLDDDEPLNLTGDVRSEMEHQSRSEYRREYSRRYYQSNREYYRNYYLKRKMEGKDKKKLV